MREKRAVIEPGRTPDIRDNQGEKTASKQDESELDSDLKKRLSDKIAGVARDGIVK